VGILIFFLILLIYTFWFSESSSISSYALAYDGNIIYRSSSPIIYSSDGSSYIYYGTPTGVIAYNIETKVKNTFTTNIVSGMAYDTETNKILMIINGNLFSANPDGTNISDPLALNISRLYDTIDGYYMAAGETYTIFGTSKAKNLGDYGMISFDIIAQ